MKQNHHSVSSRLLPADASTFFIVETVKPQSLKKDRFGEMRHLANERYTSFVIFCLFLREGSSSVITSLWMDVESTIDVVSGP